MAIKSIDANLPENTDPYFYDDYYSQVVKNQTLIVNYVVRDNSTQTTTNFQKTIIITDQDVFAQEEQVSEISPRVDLKPEFYLYMHHQNNFGSNFLSVANKPQFLGIGLQINMVKAYNFKVGLGGEYIQYNVTNEALAGNIEQSLYSAAFIKVQYEINVGQKWVIEPLAGIGKTRIKQKSGPRNFDDFFGTTLYLGSNLVYKLTNHMAGYLGADYSYTNFNVKTAAAHTEFFHKANQVQLQLGLIFSVGTN